MSATPNASSTAIVNALAPLPRSVIIPAFLLISVILGCNHVCARIAFEHGANVTAAVAVRSSGAVLFTLILLYVKRVPIVVPAGRRMHALIVGLLFLSQSYCVYSAISLIPVALALLVFNAFPILMLLVTWATGIERPGWRTFVAMPAALFGLALALDIGGVTAGRGFDFAGRWQEIGLGVLWALGAAVSMASGLLLTNRWLGGLDGRVRTLTTMSVIAVVMVTKGVLTESFVFPVDQMGWLGLALLTLLYSAGITGVFMLMPRSGAVSNTAALNFEPVAVLAIAWVVLGQTVAPLQIVGAFIVIGAIIAVSLLKK